MKLNNSKLNSFFEKLIKIPNCEEKTRSYIISIFASISSERDFTNESLTFALKRAHDNKSFNSFRELGDYLFFTKSMFPQSLKGADLNYYDSIARTSYYKCFLLLNKQWVLYEDLADQFPRYTKIVNQSLNAPKRRLPFGLSHNSFL